MKKQISLLLWPLLILASCAGPADPFGALDLSSTSDSLASGQNEIGTSLGRLKTRLHDPEISIKPRRIITHRSQMLEISIYDPISISEEYQFQIYFNGRKVQSQWINKAEKIWSQDHRQLTLRFPSLRFLPRMDNQVVVEYKRMPDTASFFLAHSTADCPLQSTANIENFDIFQNNEQSDKTFKLIEEVALENAINPALLAGLVAQESSFNPHAVSWAKAIGLTQITDLAAHHVLEKYPTWPRYPKIGSMNSFQIKSLIMLNKLHGGKEWRLDHRYSLLGGIEYLTYLQNYWQKEENKQILSNTFSDNNFPLTQILLASYNSGAYRVKKALESQQQNWLNDASLSEAKIYVNNINSYCYVFHDSTEQKKPQLALNSANKSTVRTEQMRPPRE